MVILKPKISIVMPTLNTARFIRSAVESITRQTFSEWELIVMDGGSTDGTLDILSKFPHPNIRVFSEPDEGIFHAITKGFERASGDYFMTLCGSDGYVDCNWLRLCVDVLDADPEVSLVWGIPAQCTEDGKVGGPHPAYSQFLRGRPSAISPLLRKLEWKFSGLIPEGISRRLLRPLGADDVQKQDWLLFWLNTGLIFPDLNMCCRRTVYKKCMTPYRLGSRIIDEYMPFYFNFNQQGYLPLCIARIANFGRTHAGQAGNVRKVERKQTVVEYLSWVRNYAEDLRKGRKTHWFRDGSGTVIGQWLTEGRNR